MTNITTGTESFRQHSTFPPFQSEYFASQLASLAVCFVLLYVLMSKIALPRIGSILSNRSRLIAGDLNDAQRFKEQLDAANAANSKSLADAHERAREIATATQQRQAAEAAANFKQLEAQLHQRLTAAEQSISAASNVAMRDIEAIAKDAATAIVGQLIGQMPVPQRARPVSLNDERSGR